MLNGSYRTGHARTDNVSDLPILVTVSAACKLLSLGRTTVYQLITDGLLAKHKCGKRTLISMESINGFVLKSADPAFARVRAERGQ